MIAAADGLPCRFHDRGIRRPAAEEVGDDERAVAPALGIDARPRARRIEMELVCRAGVQHEEIRDGLCLVPTPPEQIAPTPARGKARARRTRDDRHRIESYDEGIP